MVGEFMVNMNIMSEELPEFPKMTLEDYANLVHIQLKKAMENYKNVDEGSTTISGLPARTLTYTASSDETMLMGSQAYVFKENVAYVITYTATEELYDKYADCFELVMTSFEFE